MDQNEFNYQCDLLVKNVSLKIKEYWEEYRKLSSEYKFSIDIFDEYNNL